MMSTISDALVVVFLLSMYLECSHTTSGEHELMDLNNMQYSGPYFDTSKPRNFTAQVGSAAYLACTIRQLGDKIVSWVRSSDSEILAVGKILFNNDPRFQIHHTSDSDTWTLQIKQVTPNDAGLYECQISTEVKKSIHLGLKIIVPKVEVLGGPAIYVNAGSEVSLKCKISNTLTQPAFVFWFKDGESLSSDNIEQKTEIIDSKTMISSVSFPKATLSSSGLYTCSPSSLNSANVTIHIINGEQPAAMYDRNRASGITLTTQSILWQLLKFIGLLIM